MEKTRYEFESGGLTCRGWFYRPEAEPPYACVVMAHGFGAAPDGPLGDLARRFATAGIAAYAFDFRHTGESDGEPRQLIDIRRHLEDWRAAIARVRSRADVNANLIGLWGSSLTGGEVLEVAAHDRDIAAVVSQVPYVDGFTLARAAGLRHLLSLLPAVTRDFLRAAARRPPYLIDGLAPPGDPAMVSGQPPELYEALVKAAPSWKNKVTARSLAQIYTFRPIRVAHRIRTPLLVVLAYGDNIAPSDVAMRAAQGLPYVELALFPAQHFELYSGPTYERAAHTETRFFSHHFARRSAEEPGEPASEGTGLKPFAESAVSAEPR